MPIVIRRAILTKILKIFLSFLFGLLIAVLIFKLTIQEIPIMGFHDVVDIENPNQIPPQRPEIAEDYSKQDLTKFIEYLVENDYWLLSTQELYDYFLNKPNQPIPEQHQKQKPIMLTFDDGYLNTHQNLLAILENIQVKYQRQVKVVLFINPAFMGVSGSQLDHASCDQLRQGLAKGYYDLQSHGMNHLDLVKLDANKLEFELKQAQIKLRQCTQKLDSQETVASHLAYPFGQTNPQVETVVKKYYLSAYLYDSSMLHPQLLRNKYHIPRLTINRKTSLKRLKLLAKGGWF